MRRFVLNLLTVLSLLLCVGSVIFWVRSYPMADYVAWRKSASRGMHEEREYALLSVRGRVSLNVIRSDLPAFDEEELRELEKFTGGHRFSDGLTGGRARASLLPGGPLGFDCRWTSQPLFFRLAGRHRSGRSTDFQFAFPHWALAALTGGISVVGGRSFLRRRRVERWRREGRCLGCGYDLRATPGQCPECGLHNPDQPTSRGPARKESPGR